MTLETGMLWYDDNHKATLEARITRAVEYYTAKLGHAPNVCVIKTGTDDAPAVVAGVRVARARVVLVDHYWLGVEEL